MIRVVRCLLLCLNMQVFPARMWEMVQSRGLSRHNSGSKSAYGHVAKPLLYILNAVRPSQDFLSIFIILTEMLHVDIVRKMRFDSNIGEDCGSG